MRTRVKWLLAAAAGGAGLLLLRVAGAQSAAPASGEGPVRSAQGQAFFTPAGAASQAVRRAPLPPAQRQERRFLQSAAVHLALQAEASRLVMARSSNTSVRDLAAAAIARHGDVQSQVLRLLHAREMALPLAPNEHRKLLRRMESLQGGRLDRVYVEEVMLRSVQAELDEYEHMALQAGDEALRAWIERQLPVLRHLLARSRSALPAGALRGAQRAL